MKIEVKNLEKCTDRPFPKLMTGDNGIIILFIENGKSGIVLHEGLSTHKRFYMPNGSWDMTGLRDFKGSITLSND